MKTSGRVFAMFIWLGSIAVIGAIVLMATAARIGEHKSSTFGNAYRQFKDSWGGEIEVLPPDFFLERTFHITVFDSIKQRNKYVVQTERLALVPDSIQISSQINYNEQELGFLNFNAFRATCSEIYVLRNLTGQSGKLFVVLKTPQNANLMYDYKLKIPQPTPFEYEPRMDEPLLLIPEFLTQGEVKVSLTYATKGMDLFKYNLSKYQNQVIREFRADFDLNTRNFEIFRFGLPHGIESTTTGSRVEFQINHFASAQDVGVVFESKQVYLDQIQDMIYYAPLSLVLFILVVFLFSQIRAVRFHAFHFLFLAAMNVFYFLFIAYLIRFFSPMLTFGVSALLSGVMFFSYSPQVLSWRFASRIVGPYFFLLTIAYSLIFIMPVFRGLSFVVLNFLIFMSLMIAISRSNISEWQIIKAS